MHGDLLLVVVILVFGCAAFLFGVIYLVCSVIGFVGRGVFRVLGPRRRATGPPEAGHRPKTLVCPRAHCRKVEHRDASYCSQCGAPLTAASDRA